MKERQGDRVAWGIEVEDGLYHVVRYWLNKENRRWVEKWRGEGRDKSGALAELMRLQL